MPILSIITINLNNASGLSATMKSVFDQVYPDFEYTVIDGGSTDESVEMLKKHQDRISFWISESDDGIYNAMNKGIMKSRGEYLLFLNSGDILADKYVLKRVFDFGYNDEIIYGDMVISDKNGTALHEFPDKLDYEYFLSNTIGHPSTIIKRELFQKIGLYNEKLKIVSDWEFFIKAIVLEKVSYKHLKMPVSIFSLDGASSLADNFERIKSERDLVLTSIFPRFNLDFHHYPHLFDSNIATIYNFLSKNKFCYLILRKLIKGLVTLKNILKIGSEFVLFIYRRFMELLIPSKYDNLHSIPVIINNFNRLAHLKTLISWLEKNEFTNINIIDNLSTYPPLLEYYNHECKYKIFRLKENKGHLALWQTNLFKEFMNDYYIYTDPDVVPVAECPGDFLEVFLKLLKKYPRVCKVGFSLKIDDLPDHYSKKEQVLIWEKQNYNNEIAPGIFYASIDTTFALYRPREKGDWKLKAIRTGHPYQARHLPWYEDDSKLSEEDIYYAKSKLSNVGHWI